MNQALPFMPPREPEELIKDIDATARKLIELDGTAFTAMFDAITGWPSMPPRQKFAYIANQIRGFDQRMQARVMEIDQLLATPPMTPEEAMVAEQQIPMLMAEREQIVTQVLPNPGLGFFQELARVDAKKSAELAKEYARLLKEYAK